MEEIVNGAATFEDEPETVSNKLRGRPQDVETLEVNGFLKEVDIRLRRKPTKSARVNGMFSNKEIEDYSWRCYIRWYFKENPSNEVKCCDLLYKNPEGFISHVRRKHKGSLFGN